MEPIFNGIVTGSRAYGTPRRKEPQEFGTDSDIDLVVLVSEEDAKIIIDSGLYKYDAKADYPDKSTTACLYFGHLNLILCTTQEQFDIWNEGTRILKTKRPVNREQACELFKSLREQRQL